MLSAATKASVSAGGDAGLPRLCGTLGARAPPAHTHAESRRQFRPVEGWTQDRYSLRLGPIHGSWFPNRCQSRHFGRFPTVEVSLHLPRLEGGTQVPRRRQSGMTIDTTRSMEETITRLDNHERSAADHARTV
jgi:hypothetical protein